MSNDLLVFRLGGQLYALPVRQVSRVVPRASLTPLAGAPAELIGVLRLRGALFPVIDVRTRLGLPGSAPHIGECIVVMNTTPTRVGLLVEGVEGLVAADGEPLDGTTGHAASRLVRRVLEVSGQVVATVEANAAVAGDVRTYLAAIAFDTRQLREHQAAA